MFVCFDFIYLVTDKTKFWGRFQKKAFYTVKEKVDIFWRSK